MKHMKIMLGAAVAYLCLFAVVFLILCGPALAMDGREMTRNFEGYSATPYIDTTGNWTIGYGHLCRQEFEGAHLCMKPVITHTRALEVFEVDYIEAQRLARRFAISSAIWVALSHAERVVLTDMAFNLGNKLFDFKHMREAVAARDQIRMIKEMRDSKWYHQTGRRPEALIKLMKG